MNNYTKQLHVQISSQERIFEQASRILGTECGTRHELGKRPDLCPKCHQAAVEAKAKHPNATHYVLVQPWAVYVKTAEFFIAQAGHVEPWGRNWRPVTAESIEAARALGVKMRGEI
jgi:hypothetical protein